MSEEMKCCGGLGLFGRCGRGTRKGCSGLHCRCMEKDCPNMHYVDCYEHYIHVEYVSPEFYDNQSLTEQVDILAKYIQKNFPDKIKNGGAIETAIQIMKDLTRNSTTGAQT